MKAALALLFATVSAVQITGPIDPTEIGTTGGADTRTHQLRSPAPTNPGEFTERFINANTPSDIQNGW